MARKPRNTYDQLFATLLRYYPDAGPRTYGPEIDEMTKTQAAEVVAEFPWVNWSLCVDYDDGDTTAETVEMFYRPDFPNSHYKKAAEFPHTSVFAWLQFLLVVGVVFVAIEFPAASTALIIGAGILGSVALWAWFGRRGRVARYRRQAVDRLRSWLGTLDVPREKVPMEWARLRGDSSVHPLLVQWFELRSELDEVEAHIKAGVRLRKHLPPLDSRRAPMQVEIEAQRERARGIVEQRTDLVSRIQAHVDAILQERREAKQRLAEAVSREAQSRREQAEYARRWQKAGESEAETVQRHEAIDRWFDQGASRPSWNAESGEAQSRRE